MSPAPKFCAECGGALPAGAKFCPQCGTKVPAPAAEPAAAGPDAATGPEAAPAPPPAAPEVPAELRAKYESARAALRGDRREVVVLFADVSGYTAMSETLDPEEVSFLMHGLLGDLAGCVHRYEGYVDKYIGDAIMALFGAPIAHEDDAERAVLAALEMLETLERRQAGGDRALSMRIGLNLGEVVAGHMGSDQRLQYTVMGDTVNVASRLETAAEPGTVLVSEAVRRRIGSDFETEELAPLALKGKSEPVRAFRVMGYRRGGGERAERTPFVGRDAELDRAVGFVRGIAEGGSGVLVVEAEAGAGKSRLVAEAIARAAQADARVRVVEADFAPLRMPGQLPPAIEVYRRLVDPGDDAGASFAETVLGDDAEAHRAGIVGLARELDPDRAPPGTIEADPQAARQNRWLALAALLRAAARHQPVLLVLEDVHAADEAAGEFLDFLLGTLPEGVGATLTARAPLEAEWLPEDAERLTLTPLGETEVRDLLGRLLDDLRPTVRRDLLRRAQGNPLYLEELARALREREGDDDAPVPGSLQGMIRSRIDRLPAPVQRLLQMAAILGPRFPGGLLERMYALEPQPIGFEDGVVALVESGFLEPAGAAADEEAGTVGPERRFRHALAQEVAYGGLLVRVRRILHETAARIGEEVYAERARAEAPFFAHHFWEAGLEVDAVPHLWTAGKGAAEAFDLPSAERFLERAVEVVEKAPDALPEPGTRAELEETTGTVLLQRGRLDDAEDRFRALEALGEKEAEPAWVVRGGEHRGRVAWYRGRLDEAEDLFRAALARLEDDSGRLAADLHNDLGLVRIYKGDAVEARAHHERALALRMELGDKLGMAKSFSNLGNVLVDLGDDLEGAEEHYERALQLAVEISDRTMRTTALNNLARIGLERGQWDRAIERFRRAEELAEEIGWSFARYLCALNQAFCEIQIGRIAPAVRKLESQRKRGAEVLEPVNRVNVHLYLADAWLRALAQDRARTAVAEARRLFEELSIAEMEDEVLMSEGRVLAAEGAWEEAAERFRLAAERADDLHHPAVNRLARAHRCRAAARAGLDPPEACPEDPGGRPPAAALLAYLAADIQATRDPSREAAEALGRAGEAAAAIPEPGLERAAYERRAQILRALGDDVAAAEAARRAADAMERIEAGIPEDLREGFRDHPRNADLRDTVGASP